MVKEELCNSTMHLNFNQLVSIVEDLTGPEGCPWDKKQTHKSLAPQILEEVYELFESIDESNPNKIMEELGDILLQIIFHSVLLKKLNKLDISDVCKNVSEKMITRHPHVFGDKESNLDIKTSEDVELKWESLKRLEKDKNRSIVSSLPKSMPALAYASEIQKRAVKSGIKLESSSKNFVNHLNETQMGEKLLGITLEIIQMGLDPESILKSASIKLKDRIISTEKISNKPLDELSKDQLNQLWKQTKSIS